jgi:hypothetical protein
MNGRVVIDYVTVPVTGRPLPDSSTKRAGKPQSRPWPLKMVINRPTSGAPSARCASRNRSMPRSHFALYVYLIFLFSLCENIWKNGGLSSVSAEAVVRHAKPRLHGAIGLDDRVRVRAHAEHMHDCVFAIRRKNVDLLEPMLTEISDPLSPSYGQYLTRQELGVLTMNPVAVETTEQYLSAFPEIVQVSKSSYGEYLTYRAPIRIWEQVFVNEFYHIDADSFRISVDARGSSKDKVTRALHYTLPEVLETHVQHVYNTVEVPMMPLSPTVQTSSRDRHTRLGVDTSKNIWRGEVDRDNIDLLSDDGTICTTPAILKSYCKSASAIFVVGCVVSFSHILTVYR